jgi:hypothetical protein
MTFHLPPHRNETSVYAAPVVLTDGKAWIAGLGDIQERGRTPDEARANLWARLEQLRLELMRIGTLGRAFRERQA